MKKALSMILILCMLVSVLPVYSSAQESADDPAKKMHAPYSASGTCGENLYWDYDFEFLAIMTIYGQGTKMELGDWESLYIEALEIDAPIENICAHAMENKFSLFSVEFPPELRVIEEYAFKGTGFESLKIPGDVIETGAFQDCNLYRLLMSHKSYIGEDAFRGSNRITQLLISADEVGDHAFADATQNRTIYVVTPDCKFGEDVFTPATEDVTYTVYGLPGSTAEETFGDAFKPLCSCDTVKDNYTVTYPNCRDGGYVTYSCGNCGETVDMSYWPVDSHEYKEKILVQPTCTEPGKKASVCKCCGDIKEGGVTTMKALGHTLVDDICTVCGNYEDGAGSCGENMTWEYNGTTRVLTLSGMGEMTRMETYPWDYCKEGIVTLVVEEGVTSIAPKAFESSGIVTVHFPSTLLSIGESAFENSALSAVRIPNSVTELGPYAFCNSAVSEIVIGSGVTYIPSGGVASNTLGSILIPQSVEGVAFDAFFCDRGLEDYIGDISRFTILNPNCSIPEDSLGNPQCGEVSTMGHGGSTLHDYVEEANFRTGDLVTKYSFTALCDCSDGSSDYAVNYPDCDEGGDVIYACNACGKTKTVATILAYGHEGQILKETSPTCTEVGEILSICTWCAEEHVTVIEPTGHDFEGDFCTVCGATRDTSGALGENLTWTFIGDTGELIISGTGEMTKMDTYPWDYYKGKLQSITIEEGVTSVAPFAFARSRAKTLKLPGTLLSIGASAFEVSWLTAVRIPNSVIEIGEGAFFSTLVSEIVFGSGVSKIPAKVVSSSNLEDIFLPGNVQMIDVSAFFDNSSECNPNLWGFTVMNAHCSIPDGTFRNPNWGGVGLYSHNGSSTDSYVEEANFWSGDLNEKYSFHALCDCSDGRTDYTVTYPDCDEGGKVIFACNVCGKTKTVATVLAYGHEYRTVETPATCTSQGSVVTECTWCGEGETTVLDVLEHSFVDGVCVCGLHKADNVDPQLKINHTLDIADGIALNYVVKAELIPQYEELFMECVIPVYGDGTTCTATKVVQLQPEEKEGRFFFRLSELAAIHMADEVQATLYIKKDGAYIASETDTYSIARYAYNQLAATASSKALKTLCADLLRYGAQAQIFKNYRTDHLADAEMTEGQKALLTNSNKVIFRNNEFELEDSTAPAVAWLGKALVLDDKVGVRFVVDASSFVGDPEELTLRISYTNFKGESKTVVLENPETYPVQEGAYAFDFDGLGAYELRSVLVVSVFHGEKQVSNRLIYSPDTYGRGKTGALGDLCRAIFAYGDSAKNFFAG